MFTAPYSHIQKQKRYRIKSMVQLNIIDKIKNYWMKGDKYRVLIVLYHK